MAVIRVEKNRNFTTMSNYHLRDKDLSLKAKGLLSQILSLPDDWDYSVRGLASICLEGKDCIVTTLKELEIKGYLVRKQLRDANGRLSGIEYIIYETPPEQCADSPCTEKPDTVKQDADRPNTAKELGIPERDLVQFLLEKKYMYRDQDRKLMPYAEYTKRGYFIMKDYYRSNGQLYQYTLFTAKGKAHFQRLLEKRKRGEQA